MSDANMAIGDLVHDTLEPVEVIPPARSRRKGSETHGDRERRLYFEKLLKMTPEELAAEGKRIFSAWE